ncbi:hypothetical protein FRB99_000508 [Tulasnella sp. 403]|nr:hypothetical protein FRB99_000508 [Tulasnella sp. 403]
MSSNKRKAQPSNSPEKLLQRHSNRLRNMKPSTPPLALPAQATRKKAPAKKDVSTEFAQPIGPDSAPLSITAPQEQEVLSPTIPAPQEKQTGGVLFEMATGVGVQANKAPQDNATERAASPTRFSDFGLNLPKPEFMPESPEWEDEEDEEIVPPSPETLDPPKPQRGRGHPPKQKPSPETSNVFSIRNTPTPPPVKQPAFFSFKAAVGGYLNPFDLPPAIDWESARDIFLKALNVQPFLQEHTTFAYRFTDDKANTMPTMLNTDAHFQSMLRELFKSHEQLVAKKWRVKSKEPVILLNLSELQEQAEVTGMKPGSTGNKHSRPGAAGVGRKVLGSSNRLDNDTEDLTAAIAKLNAQVAGGAGASDGPNGNEIEAMKFLQKRFFCHRHNGKLCCYTIDEPEHRAWLMEELAAWAHMAALGGPSVEGPIPSDLSRSTVSRFRLKLNLPQIHIKGQFSKNAANEIHLHGGTHKVPGCEPSPDWLISSAGNSGTNRSTHSDTLDYGSDDGDEEDPSWFPSTVNFFTGLDMKYQTSDFSFANYRNFVANKLGFRCIHQIIDYMVDLQVPKDGGAQWILDHVPNVPLGDASTILKEVAHCVNNIHQKGKGKRL